MTFFYGLTHTVPGFARPVPLRNVKVEANVVDMIAEVTVTQIYKNEELVAIEAIYKFPIHEAAAICDFEAEIDGNRTIKGIVKEAQQAAKEYDEAIQSDLGAYLLQEELPDVFQCSIGNITQNQIVKIRITYVTELKQDADSDQVRFVLPTAVAPRYGQPQKDRFQAIAELIEGNPPYSNETQYTLDFDIICRMTANLLSVESPTHKIKTEISLTGSPKTCRVKLAEDRTELERDFVLIIKSKESGQSRAFAEYNPKTKTYCTMLTLVPTFELKPGQTEMIFVVDRSGSMNGAPMIKARQTLELILRSLPSNCFFNVVSFGSSYSTLFGRSVHYSESSYSAAIQHARTMEANFGGTELLSVLKWVLENKVEELPTAVFLLTDGEVWNVDDIVQLIENKVKENQDNLRLFSLGIGSSVSHHLVESVARAGRGYAQFVSDDERMDKKVVKMVKNAIRPPLTDYKISWVDTESSDSDAIKYRQAPYAIPSLYQGVRCVVYALFVSDVEPARSITMTMRSRSGLVKLTVPIDPVTLNGNKIHTLAARKLIQDLEDKRSYLHNDLKNRGKTLSAKDTRNAIVKLAIDANLVSRYTSFLAIDERDQTFSTAEVQKRIVPVQASRRRYVVRTPGSSSFIYSGSSRRSGSHRVDYSHVTPPVAPSTVNPTIMTDSATPSTFIPDTTDVSCKKSRMVQMPFSINPIRAFAQGSSSTNSGEFYPKLAEIESLYEFISFQSFDGFFEPTAELSEFLSQGKDRNLFENKNQDSVWSTCIALAYLEIVMKNFKEEWELCYEKAQTALYELSGYDSAAIEKMLDDARKLVTTSFLSAELITLDKPVLEREYINIDVEFPEQAKSKELFTERTTPVARKRQKLK